ncbi:hypothetical protein NRK67_12100 [Fusobacteria bacterium ZRK30]|nr:hypothetical protein NRK67_12100 [Fusobacteria bacterium ZRK30]
MSNKNKKEKSMPNKFLRGLKILGYGKATVEANETAEITSEEAEKIAENNQKKIENFKKNFSKVKKDSKNLNIKW